MLSSSKTVQLIFEQRLRSYQWQDYFDNPNLAYERLSSSLEERAKALEIDVFKTKQQYINQLIRKEFEEKLKIEQQEQTRKKIEEELRIQEEARQHKDAEELLRKRDMGSFIEIIQVVIAFMTLSPGFVLMIISMLIVYENYGSMVAAGFSETMGWWFFGLPLLLGLIPIGGPMIYENHWPVLITEKLQEVQLDPNAIWNTPSWVPWLPRQFFLAKTLYWTGNTIVWGFNIFIFTIIIAVLIVVLVGKVRNKQSISN